MEQASDASSDDASSHDRGVFAVSALAKDAGESARTPTKESSTEPMTQGKDQADIIRTTSCPAGP